MKSFIGIILFLVQTSLFAHEIGKFPRPYRGVVVDNFSSSVDKNSRAKCSVICSKVNKRNPLKSCEIFALDQFGNMRVAIIRAISWYGPPVPKRDYSNDELNTIVNRKTHETVDKFYSNGTCYTLDGKF